MFPPCAQARRGRSPLCPRFPCVTIGQPWTATRDQRRPSGASSHRGRSRQGRCGQIHGSAASRARASRARTGGHARLRLLRAEHPGDARTAARKVDERMDPCSSWTTGHLPTDRTRRPLRRVDGVRARGGPASRDGSKHRRDPREAAHSRRRVARTQLSRHRPSTRDVGCAAHAPARGASRCSGP